MVYDDQHDQELFVAGQCAPPGQYRRIDSDVIIYLDKEDFLPASLDGHVASYAQEKHTWRALDACAPLKTNVNA